MDLKPTIVIDDVIAPELQDAVENTLMNRPEWRFIKDMSYANFDMPFPSYGFNMLFKHPDTGIVSELYEAISVPIVNSMLEKTGIEIQELYFNRAFLQLPLEKRFIKEHNGLHIDVPQDHIACVYYVNDSDGDTILYEQTKYNTIAGSKNVELVEHKRVTPKKGRMVVFDGARYHCSSQPRNGYRCIINFDLI
jgi:hypothetical protein